MNIYQLHPEGAIPGLAASRRCVLSEARVSQVSVLMSLAARHVGIIIVPSDLSIILTNASIIDLLHVTPSEYFPICSNIVSIFL